MVQAMHLYLDESGTRRADKKASRQDQRYDWFSIGDVLIRESDELAARRMHEEFMGSWNLDPRKHPLHSYDIRNKSGDFTWLAKLAPADLDRFMEGLSGVVTDPPFLGFACVIDRPGYKARYNEMYGRQPWALCKTAFAVVVERAAKYAAAQGYKLRVFMERATPEIDDWMAGYYRHLRDHGMPFAAPNMERYKPLTSGALRTTLYDFKMKSKQSPMMQIADLYLYGMAMGGYHPDNWTYRLLRDSGRLVDCHLTNEERPVLGIKYSCWELVGGPKNTGP